MSNEAKKQAVSTLAEIKTAFLKDAVSIPGTKINNDLTLNNSKIQLGDIKMFYDGQNLLVHVAGKSVIIPSSNIRGMEIA